MFAAGFQIRHSFPHHGPQILSETGKQPTIHGQHLSRDRGGAITGAPARTRAIPSPIPLPDPVTIAVLPFSSTSFSFRFFRFINCRGY
jgi:hypothetical protein